MTDYIQAQQQQPRRYTKDEINAMLDEAEAEIAAGNTIPDEQLWSEEEQEHEKIEMAEASEV